MVTFVKSVKGVAAVAPILIGGFAPPKDLDITNAASIKAVAGTIAHGAMTYYNGNTSSDPLMVGDLNDPYYWWFAGSMWGAMVDYYHYTGDSSYNDVVIDALLNPTNTGPNHDYMPPEHAFEEGNDDLGFWGFAVLAAAERNFPQPREDAPAWLDLGANIFNSLASRWDESSCGGGLRWQIYESNPNGMHYKNSVSNGGFFNVASRLYRATGNATYLEWANRIWDWTEGVGLIDEWHHVYDGVDARDNCAKVNIQSFTYSHGIYMHGAAVLANATEEAKWAERTTNLVSSVARFFSPAENVNNVMWEAACEGVNTCTVDMSNHKATLAKFMWATAQLTPGRGEDSVYGKVRGLLDPSALGAAQSCSGGDDGVTCGMRWYTNNFDGSVGLGQQLCALEVIQGLLIDQVPTPLSGDQIQVVREKPWAAASAPPSTRRRRFM